MGALLSPSPPLSVTLAIAFLTVFWPAAVTLWPWRLSVPRTIVLLIMCLFLAWAQLAQYWLVMLESMTWFDGAVYVPGSCYLFPLSLIALLYLRIVYRPDVFSGVMALLMGTNVAVAVFIGNVPVTWAEQSGLPAALWDNYAIQKICGGSVCFLIAVGVMGCVFSWLQTRSCPLWTIVLAAPTAALIIDSILFAGVLTYSDPALNYWRVVGGQMASKVVFGLVYAVCLCAHFILFEPRRNGPSWLHQRLTAIHNGWKRLMSGVALRPGHSFTRYVVHPFQFADTRLTAIDRTGTPYAKILNTEFTLDKDVQPVMTTYEIGFDRCVDADGQPSFDFPAQRLALALLADVWDELIAKHPGECVAVDPTRVLAFAATEKDVRTRATRLALQNQIIVRRLVPYQRPARKVAR